MGDEHVVTVWWLRGGEQRMDNFTAAHVRSEALDHGWQIELCDDDWKVFGVEQFEQVDRVSIRRTEAPESGRERSPGAEVRELTAEEIARVPERLARLLRVGAPWTTCSRCGLPIPINEYGKFHGHNEPSEPGVFNLCLGSGEEPS